MVEAGCIVNFYLKNVIPLYIKVEYFEQKMLEPSSMTVFLHALNIRKVHRVERQKRHTFLNQYTHQV